MDKMPVTLQGMELMREELTQLKTVDRPRIIQAIADAREHGDLKENAEYHAAREQQSFAEGRIQELESAIGSAQVIDVSKLPQTGKVVFGVTVEMEEIESGDSVTYQIVGEFEADIKAGKISVTSPIARAMIGKEEGEEVIVNAPGGKKEFEIIEVRYS